MTAIQVINKDIMFLYIELKAHSNQLKGDEKMK